jgi:hypothetical protein
MIVLLFGLLDSLIFEDNVLSWRIIISIIFVWIVSILTLNAHLL